MAYLADFLPQDACIDGNGTSSTILPTNTSATGSPKDDEKEDLDNDKKGHSKSKTDPVIIFKAFLL